MSPANARTAHPPAIAQIARLNGWIKDHYLGTLLVVVAVGLLFPDAGTALKHLRLFQIPGTRWIYDFPTVALTLLMLSASIHTDVRDFGQLVKRPRAFGITLVMVYAVVPILAVAVSWGAMGIVGGDAALQLRVGLMFLALMPMALTSAVWVRVNMGNTPLLLSLITLTTGLSVVTIPYFTGLLPGVGSGDVSVPVDDIVKQLVISVTMPMVVGIVLRHYCSRFVDTVAPVFALLGTMGLVASLMTNVASARPYFATEGTALLTAAVVTIGLNVLFFWIGIFAARRFNFVQEDAITLIFSAGMRNMGAAMSTGAISFPTMPLATVPAAVYSISQQIIGSYLTKFLRAGDGALLGPPIGADQKALEARLAELFARPTRRAPGLALLVFRLSGGRGPGSVESALAGVVPRVRRLLRGDDEVYFLKPDGFALVLDSTSEAGTPTVVGKIAWAVCPMIGALSLTAGIAHTNSIDSMEKLFETASNSQRSVTPPSGVAVAKKVENAI